MDEFDITPYLCGADPWLKTESPADVRRCYAWKYHLARLLRPRRVLEFGVRYGYSAAAFLAASPGAEYAGVDADNGRYGGTPGAYSWAAAMLGKKFPGAAVSVVRMDTRQDMPFLPGYYDLVHVDADHSYDGCLGDLRLATQLGNKWVLVDDLTHPPEPGVARAVKDFLGETGFDHLDFEDSFRGDCLIRLR